MASGDTLFVLTALSSIPTGTLYATQDVIVDASTPTSVTPCLDYDGSAQDEHAEWMVVVPANYAGGGFTVNIGYAMSGTDADPVQFEVRMLDVVDLDDLDTDLGMDTQTATDITDTPTGTAGALMVTTTGAVTHSNAGSPAAGTLMKIRISRDYDHAANTDDAQFVYALVKET